MKLITISREFASGGRELGKRLCDELDIAYYDKEIINEIANRTDLNEDYIKNVINRNYTNNYAYSFRHSISTFAPFNFQATEILRQQNEVIKMIAEKNEDCLIVGRGADVLLKDYNPLRIFVYADEKSKIIRCRNRASIDENLSNKELLRKMKEIDNNRANFHNIANESKFKDIKSYDLCINTSGIEIKSIIPALANLVKTYFDNRN